MIIFVNIGLTPHVRVKRYNAYDIFLYTLETYNKLPFKKLILNIEIAQEYHHLQDDLVNFCGTIFSGKNWSIELKRIKTREEYQNIFNTLITEYGEEVPILFQTNHDHPFIDFNTDVLLEGLELIQTDNSKYKMLGISHFPEFIRMAADAPDKNKIGNWIKFDRIDVDSMNIFNLRLLSYCINNMKWREDNFSSYIYRWWWISMGEITQLIKDDGTMSCFVPLREQFRHFDGYGEGHANFDPYDIPLLVLPKENNIFDNSEAGIQRKIFASYRSCQTAHTPGNPEELFPKDWLEVAKYLGSLENK